MLFDMRNWVLETDKQDDIIFEASKYKWMKVGVYYCEQIPIKGINPKPK